MTNLAPRGNSDYERASRESYQSTTGTIPQRKKLQLKPRSVSSEGDGGPDPGLASNPTNLDNNNTNRVTTTSTANKNPFGMAKPREVVLQQRGIDPMEQNQRIEKKAMIPRYTDEQEAVLETIRDELTKITEELREANEMELPEEEFRIAEEAKRKELNDIIEQFNKLNTEKATEATTTGRVTSNSSKTNNRGSTSGRPAKNSKNSRVGDDEVYGSGEGRSGRSNQQRSDNNGSYYSNNNRYNTSNGQFSSGKDSGSKVVVGGSSSSGRHNSWSNATNTTSSPPSSSWRTSSDRNNNNNISNNNNSRRQFHPDRRQNDDTSSSSDHSPDGYNNNNDPFGSFSTSRRRRTSSSDVQQQHPTRRF